MSEPIVKDLVLPLSSYATISEDATIQAALQALSKAQLGLTNDRHHHRAILVLDAGGKVVGKLSHLAILRSLEPRLLNQQDVVSLSQAGLSQDFISTMLESLSLFHGSLKLLCEAAARVRVRDAMTAIEESVDENARVTEAIHLMVLKRLQSLLVTRKGEVIGLLRLSDVFEQVADIIRCSTGHGGYHGA